VLRLMAWRLLNGLNQVQAARRLGMSHLTLGYLESGRMKPTERDLRRLARHFGDRASALFEEVDPDAVAVSR